MQKVRTARFTYFRLIVLLAKRNEANVADLSEDKSIFLAAALQERHVLYSQLAVAFFAVASHDSHHLLKLWTLKHLVYGYR